MVTPVWRDNVVDQLIPSALLEVEMRFSDGNESQDVLNILSFSPISMCLTWVWENQKYCQLVMYHIIRNIDFGY